MPAGLHKLIRFAALCVALSGVATGLAGCGGGAGSESTASPTLSDPPAPGSDPQASDQQAPSAPGTPVPVVLSSSQVQLSWQASSDNVAVTGYRVYRDGQQVATSASANYTSSGLTAATTYRFSIAAFDAAGNVSTRSAEASATTAAASPATGEIYRGNPTNYLTLLGQLKAGDTLILDPGQYDAPNDVPGLPIFDMQGEPGKPITIMGESGQPRPVLLGRSTHNTVRFDNASYIVLRHLEIDGRDLGGDGINSQGVSHDILLEDIYIHGVGENRQVVGISTKETVWNWTIRSCTIAGAGTGMYLGDSDGSAPFVAGTIEYNVIRDTLGYNIEIKHQNGRPSVSGMPTGSSSTVIRHNVFSKSSNSEGGAGARPNLLVGHFPLSGTGSNDVYEIYGNFFYRNPVEALFQGEGNIAFHHNLLVNDTGDAIVIQPHNDVPKTIFVFQNTVVAAGTGIRVTGGAPGYTQLVAGNAVFAGTPVSAGDKRDNVTDGYAQAVNYLRNPTGSPGVLDLYPAAGQLKAGAMDTAAFQQYRDWNRDFNGTDYDARYRGAYSGDGTNPGWLPRLEQKPVIAD